MRPPIELVKTFRLVDLKNNESIRVFNGVNEVIDYFGCTIEDVKEMLKEKFSDEKPKLITDDDVLLDYDNMTYPRWVRYQLGWSIEKMAKHLGLSPKTIKVYEMAGGKNLTQESKTKYMELEERYIA